MISRPTLFTVPGGDTVQVRETAEALGKIGVSVEIRLANEEIRYEDFDLIHFFNVIRPNTITAHVRKSAIPYVVSTVFVDYSDIERSYRGSLFSALHRVFGPDAIEYFKTIGRTIKNNEPILDSAYIWSGHKRSVERVLNGAAMLLPNSESEFSRLKKRYDFNNEHRCIPNAVRDEFFRNNEGVQRVGVICIGRIELIKNQLNLIKALNGTQIPLKIIGKPAPNHQKYFESCREIAGPNVQFIGQLPKEEVIKELSTSKVHVLPSFFETTGLSSLEAAAMGCNVVITDRGDTREYFEDLAFYCEPDDPDSIQRAIELAIEKPVSPSLRERVRSKYRWEITAAKTHEAYQWVLGNKS